MKLHPEQLRARLYTKEEVAREFSVTPRTIDRWIAKGRLPSVKIEGSRRFTAAALDKLLAR